LEAKACGLYRYWKSWSRDEGACLNSTDAGGVLFIVLIDKLRASSTPALNFSLRLRVWDTGPFERLGNSTQRRRRSKGGESRYAVGIFDTYG